MAKRSVPPAVRRSLRTDDERLAMEFLSGCYIREPNGRESHRYLESASEEELNARAALIRLIFRSNLNEDIRITLGALLNPVNSHFEPRELIFRFRSRGKRPDPVRDIQLATDVAFKVAAGVKVEAAIEEMMARYGVKRPTAFRAWKTYGKATLAEITARRIAESTGKSAPIVGFGIPYRFDGESQ
jgi:hypothetical protein